MSEEIVLSEDDEPVPAVSSSSRRVASQDDSSSDDNLYDDYLNRYVKKCTKVREIEEAQRYNIPPAPAEEESFLETLDSDDDLNLDEDSQPLDVMDTLAKKGQQYKSELLRKQAEEIRSIKKMAVVEEAVLGDKPEMFYPNPQAAKATAIIEKVRNARREMLSANSSPLVRSSRKEEVIQLDNYGNERVFEDEVMVSDDDEASAPRRRKPQRRRTGPSVSLNIHDFVKGSFSMEPLEYNVPFSYIAKILSERWNCAPDEVTLTVKNEALADHSKTPHDLNLSLDGIISVKAMLVATPVVAPVTSSSHASVNKPAAHIPNAITIKFQLPNGRPSTLEVNKKRPFSEIIPLLVTNLKVAGIEKLVFDNEEVDLGVTPEGLDMEDEDCMDVYADSE